MKPTPARYRCHADLIVRDRRHVSLAQVAPVDLNLIAPWSHTIMPPEAKASAAQRTPLQSGPAANSGSLPVGAHQIAIGDGVASDLRGGLLVSEIDVTAPLHADSNRSRVLGQLLVQFGAPHSESRSGGKLRRNEVFVAISSIGKMNSREPPATIELNAQSKQVPARIGRQTLAT